MQIQYRYVLLHIVNLSMYLQDIGPIYTRDGSSVWDELGQRTVVRLIIRPIIRLYKYGLSDGSSVQTNYHGSSSGRMIRLKARIYTDEL